MLDPLQTILDAVSATDGEIAMEVYRWRNPN